MSESKKQRRTLIPRARVSDYRREAATLVIDTGCSIPLVAKDIGIGEQPLGTWVITEKQRLQGAGAPMRPSGEEEWRVLSRIQRENFELKQDNEVLGKAASFLRAVVSSVGGTGTGPVGGADWGVLG